jgi:succinyl-diaminopimelate desuccinylase
MKDEQFSRVTQRIREYSEIVIKMQRKLTAIPALGPENGGTGEAQKALYIKKLLNNFKYDNLEEINAPDDRVPNGYRPNLFMKINGLSSDRTIWILSHMDIVPPGDNALWNTDPYKAVQKNGKIFGRGTEDNHQGFVSSYIAIKALQEEKMSTPFNVGLALVSDEESGSKYGIEYVLKNRPKLFQPNDYIIIPDAGDEEGILIEVAEKSILWIKCETIGKQTHSSTPKKGINAYKAAAFFITKMNELYKKFPKNDSLFDPPISTFEPTKKENNVPNINTIPGRDVTYFDCRILPNYSIKEIQSQIQKWANSIEEDFGVSISLTYPQTGEAPPPTSPDCPAAVALKKAIKTLRNKEAKTIGIGGGTIASFFRKVGLPAVCWCTLDDTLHAPNEYCKIKNVIDDALVFAHIFLQNR